MSDRIIKGLETVSECFSTTIDGSAANFDSTPTAALYINGVDYSGTYTATIANITTGAYKVTFTAPASLTLIAGKTVQAKITGVLDTKNVTHFISLGVFADVQDVNVYKWLGVVPAALSGTYLQVKNSAGNVIAEAQALAAMGEEINDSFLELNDPTVGEIQAGLATLSMQQAAATNISTLLTSVGITIPDAIAALQTVADTLQKLARADKAYSGGTMLLKEEGTDTVLVSKDMRTATGEAVSDPKTEFVNSMIKTAE